MTVLCLLTASLLVLGFPARAQFAINWHTMKGGGGTSTGGGFTISGTIGQPDAGVLSGGGFTLTGGFWSWQAAIQTEGAPWLTVLRSNLMVLVTWPQPVSEWALEWTSDLAAPSNAWSLIAPPYPASGTNRFFAEPAPVGNRFYRLRRP